MENEGAVNLQKIHNNFQLKVKLWCIENRKSPSVEENCSQALLHINTLSKLNGFIVLALSRLAWCCENCFIYYVEVICFHLIKVRGCNDIFAFNDCRRFIWLREIEENFPGKRFQLIIISRRENLMLLCTTASSHVAQKCCRNSFLINSPANRLQRSEQQVIVLRSSALINSVN